jgi:hypothetical protein
VTPVTRVPHPAFRRLAAAGATASRLHATLERVERVERELRGVTFGLDRLRLLDDAVLEPLTRRLGVAEALTRARPAPASEAPAPVGDAGSDEAGRPVRPRRVDHANGEGSARREDDREDRGAERDDERAAPAAVRGGESRTTGHPRQHARHAIRASAKLDEARGRAHASESAAARDPRFAHIDAALLRDARAAVARRLDIGSDVASGGRASDPVVMRGSKVRSGPTRRRPGIDVDPLDAPSASMRMAALPARVASTATALHIGAVSPAVTAILDRMATNPKTAMSADRIARPGREHAVGSAASPDVSSRTLDTLLERAADRASSRVPKRGVRASLSPVPGAGQPIDPEASQDASNAALHVASGLRRLIARAGVTPLSAALPPQAGVERAEGAMGVVADRVEESALAQRLGRLLRREARRDGIDLDEAGA